MHNKLKFWKKSSNILPNEELATLLGPKPIEEYTLYSGKSMFTLTGAILYDGMCVRVYQTTNLLFVIHRFSFSIIDVNNISYWEGYIETAYSLEELQSKLSFEILWKMDILKKERID